MSQIVENKLQVGDLVRVIDVDSALLGLEGYIAKTDFGATPNAYLFESDDKQHRCWFSVQSLRKLIDSWVPEPPTDHIADADKMVGAPHRDGLVLRSEWNAEEGCFEESRVELEKESQYRTPHPGDVGKRIEVSDSEDPTSDDSVWRERTLVAVLAFPGTRPHGNFVTAVEGKDAKHICHTWRFARIKVDQPAIPKGWRELHNGEKRLKTDLFDFEGEWTPFRDYDPSASEFPEYHKTIHRRHIRKIEPEKVVCDHRVCELAKPTGVTCPPDACDIDDGVRELPVEQPAIDEPTPESQGHPDHVEGVWVEEGINATSINFKPKRPVVYIAGPMRGIPHFNFHAFDAAKAYLIERGYDVLSPADFDRELDGFDPYKCEYETAEGCAEFPGEMDFRRVVTRDLKAVKQCDAIALLPCWEHSNGAVAEIAVAHWMGKPLIHLYVDHTQGKSVFHVIQESATTLKQFALWLADAHVDMIEPAIALTPPEQNPDCDILEVAASITRGDRQAVYGPPDQDFKKTADMWTGMFQYMLADGAKFEPRHVAMAMICIKLSREFHQRKRDNWIDIAGYARCGSLCSS